MPPITVVLQVGAKIVKDKFDSRSPVPDRSYTNAHCQLDRLFVPSDRLGVVL